MDAPSSTTSPSAAESSNGEMEPPLGPEQCIFCSKPLTKQLQPQTLPCLHFACRQCYSRANACTVCSEKNDRADRPFLLAETPPVQLCTPCKEEDKAQAATHYCDCGEFLCDYDKPIHTRPRDYRGHRPKKLNVEQEPRCERHKQPRDYYCDHCNVTLCSGCQPVSHQNHPVASIKDKIRALQEQCAAEATNLQNQKRSFEAHGAAAEQNLEDSETKSVNGINETFRQLEVKLTRKKDDCVATARNNYLQERNQGMKTRTESRNIYKKFDQCENLMMRMSKFGVGSGSSEMLRMLRTTHSHLELRCDQLKAELNRKEAGAMDQQPRVHSVVKSDIDQLERCLQSLRMVQTEDQQNAHTPQHAGTPMHPEAAAQEQPMVPEVGPQTHQMIEVLKSLISVAPAAHREQVTHLVQEMVFGIRQPDNFMRCYSQLCTGMQTPPGPNYAPQLTTEMPAIRLLLLAGHEKIPGVLAPTESNQATYIGSSRQAAAVPQQQTSTPISSREPQVRVFGGPGPNVIKRAGSIDPTQVKRPKLNEHLNNSLPSSGASSYNPGHYQAPRAAAAACPSASEILARMKEHLCEPQNKKNCVVCLDGKQAGTVECETCDRKFHRRCHIPVLLDTVDDLDEFNCRLCSDNIPAEVTKSNLLKNNTTDMSFAQISLCERIYLYLFCIPGFCEQFGELDQSMNDLQPKTVMQRFNQGKHMKMSQFIEELKMSLQAKPQWKNTKKKVAAEAAVKLNRLAQIAVPNARA